MTKLKSALPYVVLSIVALLSVFPILWMYVAATNTSADVLSGRLLPGANLQNNLAKVLDMCNLWTALWNSFRNAFCLTFLGLLICSMAGYGFEIFNDRRKDGVMRIVLLGMMIPTITIVIPLYQMFANFGLLNSMAACIMPTISTPFLIFLFRQSARSFPREIIQAARIDGLNEFQIFTRMFVPVMKPTYATAMTITFMNAWNSYLWPNIVLFESEQITMPIMIANLMTGYKMDSGAILLAVSISTLPTMLIFLCLQKSFVNGVAGSVKG